MSNTPFEVRDNYDKAHHDVAYLKRLDEYDLNRVYEYAQGRWLEHLRFAEGCLSVNPDYNYPERYRGGHEFDYWLDIEYQAQRCKSVLKEIESLKGGAEKQPPSEPVMPIDSEQQIQEWEYSLRQWIHIATRYTFPANEEGKRDLYFILENVDKGRGYFEAFRTALRTQLTGLQDWRAIEIDLKSRFLEGIRHYYEWYNKSEEYRAYFGLDSRYGSLMSLAESTERELLKYFPEPVASLAPKMKEGSKGGASAFDTFDKLFNKPADIDSCVNALRLIDPPVISNTGTWLNRKGSKSILVAWIERLETCGKICSVVDRRDLVPLLNNKFPGLNLGADARIFGTPTGVYQKYKDEFSALILR